LRVFIAIDLDEKIKDSLGGLINELKGYSADVRWVKPDAFHLTLKFLGEVQQTMINQITDVLKDVTSANVPFEMEIKGTGVFPNFSRPRVLWVGVTSNEPLLRLQSSVEDALVKIGFEKQDRVFHPHITLGRVKSNRRLQKVLQELRRYKELNFGKIYVNEIVLMESILSPEGATYKRLFSAELKR